MIQLVKGSIFDVPSNVYVNTVNCRGVMGKGIALEFKHRYPRMFDAYRSICRGKKLHPGELHLWDDRETGLTIVNFATKDDWRNPSQYPWITSGLIVLHDEIIRRGWTKIVIPPLGCGNGGLKWVVVKPMILGILEDLETEIVVVEPH